MIGDVGIVERGAMEKTGVGRRGREAEMALVDEARSGVFR